VAGDEPLIHTRRGLGYALDQSAAEAPAT